MYFFPCRNGIPKARIHHCNLQEYFPFSSLYEPFLSVSLDFILFYLFIKNISYLYRLPDWFIWLSVIIHISFFFNPAHTFLLFSFGVGQWTPIKGHLVKLSSGFLFFSVGFKKKGEKLALELGHPSKATCSY